MPVAWGSTVRHDARTVNPSLSAKRYMEVKCLESKRNLRERWDGRTANHFTPPKALTAILWLQLSSGIACSGEYGVLVGAYLREPGRRACWQR